MNWYNARRMIFIGKEDNFHYLLPELLDRIRQDSFADVLPIERAVSGHVHGRPAGQVLAVVGIHTGGRVPVVVAVSPWYVWVRDK